MIHTVSNNARPLAAHASELSRPHPVGRFVGAAFVFLLLFVTCAGALVFSDVSSWVKKVNVESLLGKERAKKKPPSDSYQGRALNILLIGSDLRHNVEYDENGNQLTGMHSDTTLIAHISADRRRVDMVSLPRDMLVDRPECYLPGGKKIPAKNKEQFNWAFALGGESGDVAAATACTQRSVENLSGLYIDDFTVVDMDGFEDMVKALGGVPICLDEPVKDTKGTVDLPAGCQTLSPKQAIGYARGRYGIGDGSDIGRIGRQQKLLGAMIKEALSRDYFTNLPSLYAFLRSAASSLTTSPQLGGVTTMGGLAWSLKDINLQNIRFYTLPFEYYRYNMARVVPAERAKDVFEALAHDQPIPDDIGYQDMTGKKVLPQFLQDNLEDLKKRGIDPTQLNSAQLETLRQQYAKQNASSAPAGTEERTGQGGTSRVGTGKTGTGQTGSRRAE